MTLPKSESEYGVVKRMREIRDEISLKTMNMSFEELKAYYRKEIPEFYEKLEQQNKNQSN
jgi:hypothetical protein